MLLYPFLSTGEGLFKDPIVTGRLYMRNSKPGYYEGPDYSIGYEIVVYSFHFKSVLKAWIS